MKITAIVPARDEGKQVLLTLQSLKAAGADEIILIDDASIDGSCNNPEVRALADTVVQNKTPKAPSVCRNFGAYAATGDILVFCDAHVRAKPGSLRSFAVTAQDNQGWVNAAIKPLVPTSKVPWTGLGGAFREVKDGTGYSISYRKFSKDGTVSGVSALIGAFYAIPRSVYFNRLGTWPTTISYGYNEQGVSMAAYFSGVPMVVDTNMVIEHMFKHTWNYPVDNAAICINRYLVHFVLFSEHTFRNYWLPRFSAVMKKDRVNKAALDILASPEWLERREMFKRLKKHTDEEFFQMVKEQLSVEVFEANRKEDGMDQ